jgi:hypothetical protein
MKLLSRKPKMFFMPLNPIHKPLIISGEPDHSVVYRRWRSRCRWRGLPQVGFNMDDDVHALADHALVRHNVEIAPVQRELD